MTPTKRAKVTRIRGYMYIICIYSERGHSGLQDYMSFEKSTSG